MPRNWLNIFTAVRNANQFEANQEQQVVENKRADAQLGFQQADEAREATDWDTERSTRTTLGALGAFTNMADSIANDTSIAEEMRPQAYAQAFDRIAPALQASGFDPQQVDGLRAQLLENPAQASDLLAGLEALRPGGGGSAPSLAAAFGPNGEPVFINQRTGRPAARGYAPATAVLGSERVEISRRNADTSFGNLEQRRLTNDPNHVFDVSSARSEGRVAGESAAREPEAVAAGNEVVRRIDGILNTPPEELGDVLGMPSLGGALRGGYGQYGAWPGSERANIQSDIVALSSSLRSAAYQLVLKGGGQITEAESAFAAEAFVNLQRSQSPAQFRENLVTARSYFQGLIQRYQDSAAPTRNPNRSDSGRAPAAAAPAAGAAPAAPTINVDEFLRERGM
jgi:hypothetical protein